MLKRILILQVMLFKTHIFVITLAVSLVSNEGQRYRQNCPHLYPKLFKGYIPRGNLTSGNV